MVQVQLIWVEPLRVVVIPYPDQGPAREDPRVRRLADRMLGEEADDMDGGAEPRKGTRSLLRGPPPRLAGRASHADELSSGVAEVQRWLSGGLAPEAVGIFSRTNKRIDEMGKALSDAGVASRLLSENEPGASGAVQLGTMHRAKGLEFKAVLVIGCADNVVPSSAALRGMDDPQDREAAEARECRLLYVAMTRARDELTVSWTGAPSRFLAPLLAAQRGEFQ